MSSDLEDFLRRAAQRRQANAPPAQAAPVKRSRPEYTNRQSERLTSHPMDDADDIPVAAIVVDDEHDEDPYAMQRKRIAAAKAAAEKEATKAAATLAKLQQSKASGSSTASSSVSTGNMVEDIKRMIQAPGGMQQAMILKEILDRPEHRW